MMLCSCYDNIAAIDTLYYQIVDALITAQSQLVDKRTSTKLPYEQMPDWKEVCAEQHQLSRDAFTLWSTNGKPKTGSLFHMMKSSRAKFKYLVRQCKPKTNRKESDTLAQSLLQSDSRDFWKEIRKLTNRDKCTILPDTVGGKSGEADICHM